MFAAPHDLSQRTTSFIASQRQGIHRIPLRHLIALIIDAHRSAVAVSHSLLNANDTSIERPFASNASENVAVKQTSTCWYARRRPQILPAIVTQSDALPLHDVENLRRRDCYSVCKLFAGQLSLKLGSMSMMRRWWSQTGSNRRPHACKARALPAELWPRNQKTKASRR